MIVNYQKANGYGESFSRVYPVNNHVTWSFINEEARINGWSINSYIDIDIPAGLNQGEISDLMNKRANS